MKTIREGSAGKVKLRLVQTDKEFVGVVIEGGKTSFQTRGQDADAVWTALQAELSRGGANWFGHDGARSRFLHWFAGGFHSLAYLKDERDYKLKAKARLEATTPVEAAATGSGHGEAVLAAYRGTNLLYPVEKTRLQKLLRGADADRFVQAAARFALSDGVGADPRAALAAMERLLLPHDNAKWTVATYLPFLWRPDRHIFLKPEVTRDFASRVMHPLAQDYEAGLSLPVYASLLDMAGGIRNAFADLQPRDLIDIQSVIWVVGDYRDGKHQPQP
ncbi:hypothetical protein [Sphingomonas sp.]|jgi:hypothetical protein|uniref:hypothetical protein n=1 Tax=Sphingomonas sp. TaxID=28214 RepID=UPI002603645E|nr:hypothetical protein [Sphingomonas sp.]MDF2603050.1 hypothetical protein [Sphingomonas sp.]